jgi:tetratricopeptide (TPR) repeat protein
MGSWLAAGPFAAEPPPEEIAKAVHQLGDDRFMVREQATAFLWKAGKAAEPALREALKSDDLEVVRRASALLTKFKWGIYPDTPRDLIMLINEYRSGDGTMKQKAVRQLLQKGNPGFGVVMKIAAAEENAAFHQMTVNELRQELNRTLPALLAEGQDGAMEELLEFCLEGQMEAAVQNFAAYLWLRNRLEPKIAQFKARFDKYPESRTAEILTHLYRVKGDLAAASQTATKADNPALLGAILLEHGAWKDLLARHPLRGNPQQSKDVEALGFLAAYQRLAGEIKELDQTIAALRQVPAANPRDSDLGRSSAEVLLLNDRPQEGLDVLIHGKAYGPAFDLLCAQMRYREAFALAEQARAENSKSVLDINVVQARVLYSLGDKEKAFSLLAKTAGEIKDPDDIFGSHSLIEVEYQLGLQDDAYDHAAAILARLGNLLHTSQFLSQVFPNRGESAAVWWRFLRRRHGDEEPATTMKRVRDFIEGKTPAKELDALADQVERFPQEIKVETPEQWLMALADAYEALGQEERARTYLDKAVAQWKTPTALVRLGDYLAGKNLWRQAAERYQQAWEKDRKDPASLYLWGWALTRAGQDKEGHQRMELAHLLPLGDEKSRFQLADVLARHDLTAAANREYEVIVRTGQFDSWQTNNARRRLARAALIKKDYGTVAALDERAMLECLKKNTHFVKPVAYVAVPHLIHRHRARSLLAAGKSDEALKEIQAALTALPGEVEFFIHLVPELARSGRQKEAEELFQRGWKFYEKLCTEYPQSSLLHNSLAWLAARCRRNLDQAQEHARRAVELAPKNAGFLDTLAEVHFQRGDKDTARALMKKCIAMNPKRDYYRRQLRRFEAGDPNTEVPLDEE